MAAEPLPQNAGLDAYRDLSDAKKLVAYDQLLARYEAHLEESRWLHEAWIRWRERFDRAFYDAENLRRALKRVMLVAQVGWSVAFLALIAVWVVSVVR